MREYTYLDDDRFFTFPPYPGREGAIPDRYRLDAETEFWVDPTCCRISTSEKDFYIQMVRELRPKSLDQFLFIGIGGRRILFSGPNGTTLPTQMRLDEQRRVVWEIGGIGHELRFYTGHHDHLSGTHRPFADRRQILAKDTKFATWQQQERAILLLEAAITNIGHLFHMWPQRKDHSPGRLVFSKGIQAGLFAGEFVE